MDELPFDAPPPIPAQARTPATECASCHAEIDWAEKFPMELNDKGLPKTIPVNHDSVDDPAGKIEVWSEPVIPVNGGAPARVLYARYLNKSHPHPQPGHHRGVSHFATCPQAGQWRSNPKAAQRRN